MHRWGRAGRVSLAALATMLLLVAGVTTARWLSAGAAEEPPAENAPAENAAAKKAAGDSADAGSHADAAGHGEHATPPPPGRPHNLPLPHTVANLEYEQKLRAFITARKFEELGWATDKRIRDTGPYIDGTYYGTHPAVRIFYSPEMITWLQGGRRGPIADGAMMIKEQFAPPAARYDDMTEEQLLTNVKSWTIMVKDAEGSFDGWYWSELSPGHEPADNKEHPFHYPTSGFGIYCIRCHTTAKSPGKNPEYTFSTLANIKGFPGQPLVYRVDDSWRRPAAVAKNPHEALQHGGVRRISAEKEKSGDTAGEGVETAPPVVTADAVETEPSDHGDHAANDVHRDPPASALFLEMFPEIKARSKKDVRHIPGVSHDWVVPSRDGKDEFLTSNQCMNCHAGLAAPFGPTMFIPLGEEKSYGAEGLNISPYGEWRWSPMGLAGRDPVFHAQLESEIAIINREYEDQPELRDTIRRNVANTCLRCHGAMGQRAHAGDAMAAHGDAKPEFTPEHFYNTDRNPKDPDHPSNDDYKYAALAREGISCMICHRLEAPEQPEGDTRSYTEFFVAETNTGHVKLAEPGILYGPYKDDAISPYGMKHAIGLTPKYSSFLRSSRACASCHTVNVPVLDDPLEPGEEPDELVRAENNPELRGFQHNIEQATYLEWVNSEYQDETDPENPKARSCQSCHMPKNYRNTAKGIDIPSLATRIATVQDETYPHADHLAPYDDIRVRVRNEFSRHELLGLNAFLLEMFRQFDPVLGVRKTDYMTGGKRDLDNAIDNVVEQAEHRTATLNLEVASFNPETRRLEAHVTVHNKAGHRFPSGVGFRRAFLEFVVVETPATKDGAERVLWGSGRTNGVGVIVDNAGHPLSTEFFETDPEKKPNYQKHHEVITSDQQVQVYEELMTDAKGRLTTSFLHTTHHLKDNRLLPRGWKPGGPAPGVLTGRFLKATHPGHDAALDPRYGDGSGSDRVTYRVDLPKGFDPARVKVRAKLYYQAQPPYYLKQRFETAPDGEATQRLHYLVSRMKLDGTPIEGWKLGIAGDEAALPK